MPAPASGLRTRPVRRRAGVDHPDGASLAGTRTGSRAVTGQGSKHHHTLDDEASEANPRWLLTLGAVLLIAMLFAAAFALGVYFAERNLL